MRKLNKFLILLFFVLNVSFNYAFAEGYKYTPYAVGQSLGKISHKSFKATKDELVKKDFIAGFDDTILNQKPNIDKISDEDSYEVGMIIAAQYKSKLKKITVFNKSNNKEFVKGFNGAVESNNETLNTEDKQILKHFKITPDND